MLVYNKTNQVQEIRVRDFHTGRNYNVYIGANGSMDLHYSLSIINMQKLIDLGIICVVGYDLACNHSTTPVVSTQESTNPVDISEDSSVQGDVVGYNSDTQESTNPVDISEDSSDNQEDEIAESTGFKCSICGGEYASARGLANHMNKSHKNDLPEEV